MHRFGRSAQSKMNDRWGGVFILAVVLAVAGAWQLGGWLGNFLGDEKQAAMEPAPGGTGITDVTPDSNGSSSLVAKEFQVHFVQVGAFRSEGAARNLVKQLSDNGYTAMVTARGKEGLAKVMVGPYMTGELAEAAKAELAADKQTAQAFNVVMTVDYKPDAVMAMAGSANTALQTGLDALNGYLYEAGAYFAKRAAGEPADAMSLVSLSNEISRVAQGMVGGEAEAVNQFLAMVDVANTNMADIQVAATAMPGTEDFQKAMSGYVALLERYHSFHADNGVK